MSLFTKMANGKKKYIRNLRYLIEFVTSWTFD